MTWEPSRSSHLVAIASRTAVCDAGISEEDLIADMPTLTPMSVKRLLAILGKKQMILVQEVDRQEIDLPAIFAPASTPKARDTLAMYLEYFVVQFTSRHGSALMYHK